MRHKTIVLFALAALLPFAGARVASADRASAAAALPQDDSNPFLTIVMHPSRTAKFDDLARKPEFVVYASGQFLLQKTDDRLYRGLLTKDETLDLMDFLLTDAKLPSISLNYLIAMPFADVTEYAFRTRTGSWTHRLRSSVGLGSGVSDGTAALKKVDRRRFALGDRADTLYRPGVLLVITRRVEPESSTPVWGWNAQAPFAALANASDVGSTMGAIVDGPRAEAVREATAQGRYWRFGADAFEIRVRQALPHEVAMPHWGSTPDSGATPPIPPPVPAPLPEPTPGPTPGPTPVPELPTTEPRKANSTPPSTSTPIAAPAAPEWKDDDVDFAGVQAIIRGLKKKASGSPHGTFWEKPYEKFVDLSFDIPEPAGKIVLLKKGDGDGSNFIRALKGQPLLVQTPEGKTVEKAIEVMPAGRPMAPADIERIRRWIDHGAPEKKPSGSAPPGAPTEPATAPTKPSTPEPPKETATPTGPGIPLYLVGEGVFGISVRKADGPDSDPALYVARNEPEWKSIFDAALPERGSPNGKAIADRLKPYRDGALGYDYGGSQLVLLVSPVAREYLWTVAPTVATLSDGSGRITVAFAKENPEHELSPPFVYRWAIYRSASNLPTTMTLRAPSGRSVAASSAK